MKKTGAELVRYALEQIGARFTFGIPGVHTTEIYDQLASSPTITPIRVTAEGGGAFMADAVSRTNPFPGVLLIVPAAGTAMAYPGIGEAFLDGIPMLVISGGVRNDLPFRYQLHEIDQLEMVRPITKERWQIGKHADVVPTIFEAWRVAASGEPGPVFVEVPMNIQLFPGEAGTLPDFAPLAPSNLPDPGEIDAARRIIEAAEHPGLFLGWGARDATEFAIELAERLEAPVATTLQGLSVFPATHPLHTGMGVGPAATPAGTNAFADCDALIAVGTRFGEIATGSFGLKPSWKLVHADINPNVFNANYPAAATITGDARDVSRRCWSVCRDSASARAPRRRGATPAHRCGQAGLFGRMVEAQCTGPGEPGALLCCVAAAAGGRQLSRGRRRQPHFSGRRAFRRDAQPTRDLAVRLQLHGLLRAGGDWRQAHPSRARGRGNRRRRRVPDDRHGDPDGDRA